MTPIASFLPQKQFTIRYMVVMLLSLSYWDLILVMMVSLIFTRKGERGRCIMGSSEGQGLYLKCIQLGSKEKDNKDRQGYLFFKTSKN